MIGWSKIPVIHLREVYGLGPFEIMVFSMLDAMGRLDAETGARRVETSERALASSCGMSRDRLRNSLMTLEHHGLLTRSIQFSSIYYIWNPVRSGALNPPELGMPDVPSDGDQQDHLGMPDVPRFDELGMPDVPSCETSPYIGFKRSTEEVNRMPDGIAEAEAEVSPLPLNLVDFDSAEQPDKQSGGDKSASSRASKPVDKWTNLDLAYEFRDRVGAKWGRFPGDINLQALARQFRLTKEANPEVDNQMLRDTFEVYLKDQWSIDNIRGKSGDSIWKNYLSNLGKHLHTLVKNKRMVTPSEPLSATETAEIESGGVVSRVHVPKRAAALFASYAAAGVVSPSSPTEETE